MRSGGSDTLSAFLPYPQVVEQTHAARVADLDSAAGYGQDWLIDRSGNEFTQRGTGVALAFDACLVVHAAALNGVIEPRWHDRQCVGYQCKKFARAEFEFTVAGKDVVERHPVATG